MAENEPLSSLFSDLPSSPTPSEGASQPSPISDLPKPAPAPTPAQAVGAVEAEPVSVPPKSEEAPQAQELFSQGAALSPADIERDAERLASYCAADPVYQSLREEDAIDKIRVHLALRYLLLLFAFFLVFAWIVSNRIIMFGFSESVLLARIRDGLFAIITGLFAMTLWLGSQTWTQNLILIWLIRGIGVVFFVSVLAVLYL